MNNTNIEQIYASNSLQLTHDFDFFCQPDTPDSLVALRPSNQIQISRNTNYLWLAPKNSVSSSLSRSEYMQEAQQLQKMIACQVKCLRDYHIPVIQVQSFDDLVKIVRNLDDKDAFRVHIILICSQLEMVPRISSHPYLCQTINTVIYFDIYNCEYNVQKYGELVSNLALPKYLFPTGVRDVNALISQINVRQALPNFVNLADDAHKVNILFDSITVMTSDLQAFSREIMVDKFLELAEKLYPEDYGKIYALEMDYRRNDFKQMQAKQILNWYTRPAFLYRMLNNLLRCSDNPLELFYLQPIVHDLVKAIKNQYEQSSTRGRELFCYRGATFSKKQLQFFQQNVGTCIDSLGFLSTSTNKNVAEQFAKNAIIQIKVSAAPQYKQLDYGYVFVSKYSSFPAEDQVLFNVLNSFKVITFISLQYGSSADIYYRYKQKQSNVDCDLDDEEIKVLPSIIRKVYRQRVLVNQGSVLKNRHKFRNYYLQYRQTYLFLQESKSANIKLNFPSNSNEYKNSVYSTFMAKFQIFQQNQDTMTDLFCRFLILMSLKCQAWYCYHGDTNGLLAEEWVMFIIILNAYFIKGDQKCELTEFIIEQSLQLIGKYQNSQNLHIAVCIFYFAVARFRMRSERQVEEAKKYYNLLKQHKFYKDTNTVQYQKLLHLESEIKLIESKIDPDDIFSYPDEIVLQLTTMQQIKTNTIGKNNCYQFMKMLGVIQERLSNLEADQGQRIMKEQFQLFVKEGELNFIEYLSKIMAIGMAAIANQKLSQGISLMNYVKTTLETRYSKVIQQKGQYQLLTQALSGIPTQFEYPFEAYLDPLVGFINQNNMNGACVFFETVEQQLFKNQGLFSPVYELCQEYRTFIEKNSIIKMECPSREIPTTKAGKLLFNICKQNYKQCVGEKEKINKYRNLLQKFKNQHKQSQSIKQTQNEHEQLLLLDKSVNLISMLSKSMDVAINLTQEHGPQKAQQTCIQSLNQHIDSGNNNSIQLLCKIFSVALAKRDNNKTGDSLCLLNYIRKQISKSKNSLAPQFKAQFDSLMESLITPLEYKRLQGDFRIWIDMLLPMLQDEQQYMIAFYFYQNVQKQIYSSQGPYSVVYQLLLQFKSLIEQLNDYNVQFKPRQFDDYSSSGKLIAKICKDYRNYSKEEAESIQKYRNQIKKLENRSIPSPETEKKT